MNATDNDGIVDLHAQPIDAARFAPFGTLIAPSADGGAFGPADARLELDRGRPRFYVMRLQRREATFEVITRHRAVTQCLASAQARPWTIVVAPPGNVEDEKAAPDPGSLRAFVVPAGTAVALHRGTWHVGPFFHEATHDFFNLELTDTNEVDHQDHRLDRRYRLAPSG